MSKHKYEIGDIFLSKNRWGEQELYLVIGVDYNTDKPNYYKLLNTSEDEILYWEVTHADKRTTKAA